MPGIIGIIDFKRNASTKTTLEQMKSVLNYSSPIVEEVCATDNAAIAVQRQKESSLHKLMSENQNVILAFWGNIWDNEALINKIAIEFDVKDKIPIGQLLLTIYKNEGLEGFYKLNGRFVIALWDKKDKILKIVSDKYGFCKLFYWFSSDRIVFASEYKAIICDRNFKKKMDEEALGDFMTLGYCLGDKTFFEEIKLLPHGSVLTFKEGETTIERYWDYTFKNCNSPFYELDEYVERYYALLEKALKRQIEGKKSIGLPLSGGLDSRALAGMIDKIGFQGDVKAFSYGNPDCFDVVYGTRIAKKLGFDHEYIPIESAYLKDKAEAFVWLTEGAVNCLNAHMMLTHAVLRENGINTIVTGFLGDTLAGEPISGLEPFKESKSEDEFIKRVFDKQAEIVKEDEMPTYFRKDVYGRIEGNTFATYRSDYLKQQADNRYFRSLYAELIGRQRRYTSFNLYAFEELAEVIAPFMDNDFVDFALQIPDSLASTRIIEKEMIVRYLPKVASVPWNKTRLPLNTSWLRKGIHWRWERLNRNPFVRVTIGRKYSRMNDNYLNSGEAIRTGSRDFVIEHTRGNPFLAQYFNMDNVHQMLDDHMNGKVNEQGKITAFLTLSLWHKLFIEGEGLNSEHPYNRA